MKLPLIRATFLARVSIWLAGGYAIWQGAGIITGGPERFAGPSFAVLRGNMEDPTLVWGSVLIAAGAVVLASSLAQQASNADVRLSGLVTKAIGLIGIAVWSLCFAKGAFDAAAAIPTLANTGGKTYVYIALAVLVLVLVDERRLRHDGRR